MKKVPHILILNGPNLNMLGTREPKIYGRATLRDVEKLCQKTGTALGLKIECRQSNHEGELVTWIQKSNAAFQGIVINGGALSHTSIALLDALKLVKIPIVEVHISNIFAREKFRHHSYISMAATGVICGLGIEGYVCALRSMAEWLLPTRKKK